MNDITLKEYRDIHALMTDDMGEHLFSENITVLRNYTPDGPGTCGPIFYVQWPGGAEMVSVYARDRDGNMMLLADTFSVVGVMTI